MAEGVLAQVTALSDGSPTALSDGSLTALSRLSLSLTAL
jgi:hypothetical protein